MNYTVNTSISQDKCRTNTWIYIQFANDDVTAELGNILPYPHRHWINEQTGSITYAWLLDGFFDTRKGLEYLNDVIARFILTFPQSKYIKHYKDSTSTIKPLKLKSFYNLKSKTEKRKEYIRADVQYDTIFWVLKYYAEDLIRSDGFIIYDKLYSYAVEHFIDKAKDKSTLKAKCRNIYNWYSDRDWKIGRENRKYDTKEELMASRSDHMKRVNKAKAEEKKRIVTNLTTGLLAHEYKKPSGKWNVTKIAKDGGVSRDTVYKYLPTD
jgi:DNA-binding phage protein